LFPPENTPRDDLRAGGPPVRFMEMELIEPGLVPCPRWRPDPDDIGDVKDMDEFCALGRT
jgi:hypothetical protein